LLQSLKFKQIHQEIPLFLQLI